MDFHEPAAELVDPDLVRVTPSTPIDAGELPTPPETRDDPRAAKAWEMGKKERKELKAKYEAEQLRAQELAKQVEEVRSHKSEREIELEKRNEELETAVGRYSLRATKEFKEKYVKPVEAEYNKAVSALTRAEMPVDDARKLAQRLIRSKNQEDVDSALSDLPRFAQNVVSTAVFNAQELERQGIEAEQNWKQTHVALEAETNQRNEVAFKKALVKDTVEAAQELDEQFGSWAFQPNPDDQAWMKQRENLVLQAQHVLSQGSERDWARHVLEGVAAPMYRKWGEKQKLRADKLQAELEARESSRPRVGSGGQITQPIVKPVETPKALTVEQGMQRAFESVGLAMPGR